MTRGVLIFAFNNEHTDYVSMAAWSAQKIKQHLGLPVAVVTNQDLAVADTVFDHVIHAEPESGGTRYFEDYAHTVTWHNAGRTNAYQLTPFDETVVLDADYVVACDDLNKLWDRSDFLCHKTAYNIVTAQPLDGLNTFGNYQMPMWWATVMMFRKSNTAAYIFDSMQMVRDNWQHYRDLYGIHNSTYRNDFALSIALGIVSGSTGQVDEIPWPLISALPEHVVDQLDPDWYEVSFTDSNNNYKRIGWKGMDFHAMGKQQLEKIIAAS